MSPSIFREKGYRFYFLSKFKRLSRSINVKSLKHGKDISVSVENITPLGIWIFVKEKEYFLSYKDYPYFKDQTLSSIQKVQLLHGYHLYWTELDVDLEIDNVE